MVGSHSMYFIHSGIGLIPTSHLSEHSFKWWTPSCTVMSWHAQSDVVIIIWYNHFLGKSNGMLVWGTVCSSSLMMAWNSLDTPLLVSCVLIHTFQGIPYNIAPLWGLLSWHQCKGTEWWVALKGCRLRFSSCSGSIITRCWSLFISYLLVF